MTTNGPNGRLLFLLLKLNDVLGNKCRYLIEHKTFDILAAEWLRLMRFETFLSWVKCSCQEEKICVYVLGDPPGKVLRDHFFHPRNVQRVAAILLQHLLRENRRRHIHVSSQRCWENIWWGNFFIILMGAMSSSVRNTVWALDWLIAIAAERVRLIVSTISWRLSHQRFYALVFIVFFLWIICRASALQLWPIFWGGRGGRVVCAE